MRLLIAEDEPISRHMLVAMLRTAGHEVAEADDGIAALKALEAPDAPSLAILDWIMPGMDGIEVLRRVREQATAQPPYIIMLTSRTNKADIIAGLDAGANDYLTKPFDPGELRARVEVGRRMLDLQAALAAQVEALRQSQQQVKILRGILPICAKCKKIRDDQGYWKKVEIYIRDHSEAFFTHGLCPECAQQLYPST